MQHKERILNFCYKVHYIYKKGASFWEKLLVKTLNAREIHKECKAGWQPGACVYIVAGVAIYVNI